MLAERVNAVDDLDLLLFLLLLHFRDAAASAASSVGQFVSPVAAAVLLHLQRLQLKVKVVCAVRPPSVGVAIDGGDLQDVVDLGVEGALLEAQPVIPLGSEEVVVQTQLLILVSQFPAAPRREAQRVAADVTALEVTREGGGDVAVVEECGEAAVDDLGRHGDVAEDEADAVVLLLEAG